ncbi:MAG: sel1 repeat family protein [Gammaproteobacteria bacterium]|nr:sel1 repeat family protein [Gammaproteobacteria bacterium]
MQNYLRKLTLYLVPVVALFCNSSFADSTNLEKAIETYYAGYPDQAIGMIKPQAMSGDINAQYLLGNILYGLSNSGQYSDVEDPIKWYKMAAEQGSAAANYALGVIYNNRWNNTHQQQDVEQARLFSQKAADLVKLLAEIKSVSNNAQLPGAN